jgi:predicted double-glycine peptidase
LEQDSGSAAPTAGEAERELLEFIRRYPESPLVHAAVRRIARMHGGDIPPAAEAVRKEAVAAAESRRRARETARSLCGPEVLAEVLRRGVTSGSAGTASASALHLEPASLARELRTDHQGTTFSSLAAALRKRGFQVKGLRLTWKGLWQITNGPQAKADAPESLIALVRPGHFVLVEDVMAGWVTVWDPSAAGPDQPGRRRYSRAEWESIWNGVALRVDRGE